MKKSTFVFSMLILYVLSYSHIAYSWSWPTTISLQNVSFNYKSGSSNDGITLLEGGGASPGEVSVPEWVPATSTAEPFAHVAGDTVSYKAIISRSTDTTITSVRLWADSYSTGSFGEHEGISSSWTDSLSTVIMGQDEVYPIVKTKSKVF